MKRTAKEFCVHTGEAVELKRRPTLVKPVYESKQEYKQLLDEHVARLSALQELLYASNQYALLVIFQAMDAAGKDGCIKHVMSGVNPQGCDVFSYSHPSAAELRHDFLWRTTRDLPERGKIVIFNRSYYEEVLIVHVHPEILHAEALADDGEDKKIWPNRYRSIVGLERHLHDNGTRIVKIFLHVSKEEQRRRLLARIDHPRRTGKSSNQTSRSENTGASTARPMRIAYPAQARGRHPGTLFQPMTSSPPDYSSRTSFWRCWTGSK